MQFILKSFYSPLLLSLVLACNSNNSQATKQQAAEEPTFAEILSDADMLEIRWVLNADQPDTDSILFVHDSNYIQKLITEISKEETEANTCGTEGKIYFHKE